MPPATLADHNETVSLVAILDLLRAGEPMTRPQLITATGFGRRVVAQRVEDLIASGLVVEGPRETSTVGRPASTVRFRPTSGVVLVGEVSPSVLRAGYCDMSGRLITWSEERITSTLGPEAILDRVEVHWDRFLRTLPARMPLLAAGIGVIGPVDVEHMSSSPVLTPYGWDGAHVRELLQARYSVPVWVDNSVNMMAMAQYKLRADSASEDVVLVLVDEGIGAGLVSHGRLHRGADGVAGELGHITASDDASLSCWCGKTGCLDQIATTGAIERALGRKIFASPAESAADLPPRAIVATSESDDPLARELFRIAGEATGRVLADLVNVFNPSEIVIGGRVAGVGELFLEPLRESLWARTFPASAARLRVDVTSREDQLGLLGAGAMAIDGIFGPALASRWLAQPGD